MWGKKINKKLLSVAESGLSLKLTCSGAKLSLKRLISFSHRSFGSLHRLISNLSLSFRPSPLAIVMPNPPLTRRASALLSRAPSPRTPSTRSPVQQPLHISSTDNRKSSDSWNSSNYDPADDPDLEWKHEHVLLLTRVCSLVLYSITYHSFYPLLDARRSSCSRTHPLHWPCSPFESAR
jgi:hypothetical protein